MNRRHPDRRIKLSLYRDHPLHRIVLRWLAQYERNGKRQRRMDDHFLAAMINHIDIEEGHAKLMRMLDPHFDIPAINHESRSAMLSMVESKLDPVIPMPASKPEILPRSASDVRPLVDDEDVALVETEAPTQRLREHIPLADDEPVPAIDLAAKATQEQPQTDTGDKAGEVGKKADSSVIKRSKVAEKGGETW